MSDFYLGEIRLFAFGRAPEGWALCNGAILQITQNQALYSLLGNRFGGDGVRTFALPDLRGRAPVGMGLSTTNTNYVIGQAAGAEGVTLTQAQMSSHQHQFLAVQGPATSINETNSYFAEPPDTGTAPNVVSHPIYAPPGATVGQATDAVSIAGGGSAHDNMQPFQVLNYCISTMGIYPPRE